MPATESVKAAFPAVTEVGLKEPSVGRGLLLLPPLQPAIHATERNPKTTPSERILRKAQFKGSKTDTLRC